MRDLYAYKVLIISSSLKLQTLISGGIFLLYRGFDYIEVGQTVCLVGTEDSVSEKDWATCKLSPDRCQGSTQEENSEPEKARWWRAWSVAPWNCLGQDAGPHKIGT